MFALHLVQFAAAVLLFPACALTAQDRQTHTGDTYVLDCAGVLQRSINPSGTALFVIP